MFIFAFKDNVLIFSHLKTLDVWVWWVVMLHVQVHWHFLMVFIMFSTTSTMLWSQQGVSIRTLTKCASLCGQMSILSYTRFFYSVFVPFCYTWKFGFYILPDLVKHFCTFSDADIIFQRNTARFEGLFEGYCLVFWCYTLSKEHNIRDTTLSNT